MPCSLVLPNRTEAEDVGLAARLTLDAYPRSAAYNPRWVLAHQMGPNVLWLTEAVTQHMALTPGLRVLDLGCGKALSSIFLAKEFGVQVWATDLWIGPTENRVRIEEAGMADRVFPIHAEAHALPFAEGFFDAILSIDAYQYFGTDDLYVGYLSRFMKEGGQIGIAVPDLARELADGPPDYLAEHWAWDFCSFHTADWWRRHWAKTGLVAVESVERIPDAAKHWTLWAECCVDAGCERTAGDLALLRADAGRNLGFARMIARRNIVAVSA